MNRFATGMMIGGIVGATATMMANNVDGRTRKRLKKNGRRMMSRAGNMVEEIMDMVK